MSEVVLVSHPNKSFEGTRDLYTATDGFLLAITKAQKSLFAAATRLREEGWPDDVMVVIVDNMDSVQPIAGRLSDILDHQPHQPRRR
jgi:hypothetical protein